MPNLLRACWKIYVLILALALLLGLILGLIYDPAFTLGMLASFALCYLVFSWLKLLDRRKR